MYDYEWLKTNSKTGDLLLYKEFSVLGKLIEFFTHSNYSHCGIIIRNDNEKIQKAFNLEDNEVYFFNSTGLLKIKDYFSGKSHILAVQVNKFTDVLAFQKQVDPKLIYYYRPLTCTRDDAFYDNLINVSIKTRDLPYDVNPIDWINSMFYQDLTQDGETAPQATATISIVEKIMRLTPSFRKKETYFCSALVAYAYYKLNLISNTTQWTVITPKEFAEDNKNKNAIVFTEGNSLGSQIIMQF